jgi:hypothetical protein
MIQNVLNQAEDSRCEGIPWHKSYRGEECSEKYFLPGLSWGGFLDIFDILFIGTKSKRRKRNGKG